jgi:hypothetical protein
MSTFAQNFRGMLERSFVALPILLFGWSLFVGSTTGNIGLLVLALGQASVTPLTTWILHRIATFFGDWGFANFTVPTSSTCSILPMGFTDPNERQYSIPSYWLAQLYFFFGFLIANANSVLNMPSAPNAPADKVERRKSQAELVRIMAWGFLVLFVFLRVQTSGNLFASSPNFGCETLPGVILGGLVFYWLGNGWFRLAKECSARDSDIFGIVQGILPPGASDPPPMTCVYTGK